MTEQISKTDKAEIKEMTELILQLEPEQRILLKNGLIMGKAIFKHNPNKDKNEGKC